MGECRPGLSGRRKGVLSMATTVPGVGDEALADAVFEKVKPDIMKLEQSELQQVNLDISGAIATVLGVLPELRALREQIVKELPTFDVQRFDKLEDYALALSSVQAKYLAATQPPDDLADISERAGRARERLLAEANALVAHGVVSGGQLAQLKGANGYKNVATDVMVLCGIMRSAWGQIQGKTLTTAEDLDEASRVATRLLRIVGLREQGPAQVAEVTDWRVRAFTLLLQTYDDARRAVTYLRAAEGDTDDIIPALHPGRPRRRPGEPQSPAPGPVPPPPVTAPTAPSGTAGPVPVPAGSAKAPPAAAMASGDAKGPFMS